MSKDFKSSKSKFELKPIIEQKIFQNPSVQFFFEKWCEINDSIELKIINRQQWNALRIKNLIIQKHGNKQLLFLPRDLYLWEIPIVINILDKKTFANKERQIKTKEKFLDFSKILKNTGIYIIQRLSAIKEGKEIAKALALDFYRYGQLLETEGQERNKPNIKDLLLVNLSPEEMQAVDKFLAGDKLYKLKIAPELTDDERESERRKMLAKFFRIAKKAFDLKNKRLQQKERKENHPFQTKNSPIENAFLEQVIDKIKLQIESPKKELINSIFRRGVEKIITEMKYRDWRFVVNSVFKEFGIDLSLREKTLFEALNLEQYKKSLEQLRVTGDKNLLAREEKKVADMIQLAVSRFKYDTFGDKPAQIIKNQYINCVGASLVGGALMQKVGLNYLVVDVPRHSCLLLVFSNGSVEWRDMLSPRLNSSLTDDLVEGGDKNKNFSLKDIVAYASQPSNECLVFYIRDQNWYVQRTPSVYRQESFNHYVFALSPEYGHQVEILLNLADLMLGLAHYQEAIFAYKSIIETAPNYFPAYYNLGNMLAKLGHYQEAIKYYKKATEINPRDYRVYYNLSIVFQKLGYYQEAFEYYKKAKGISDLNDSIN